MKIAYTVPYTDFDAAYDEIESTELDIALALYYFNRKAKEIPALQKGRIVSFHGPNLPLKINNQGIFAQCVLIAKELGLNSIVLHPHKAKGSDEKERIRQQEEAAKVIKSLTEQSFSVELETFRGRNRVFQPREILGKYPLVLDTSHLSTLDSLELIINSGDKISTIHFSEANSKGVQHQPVSIAGELIFEQLLRHGWEGVLCLEYMPEFKSCMPEDVRYLSNIISGFRYLEKDPDAARHYFEKAKQINLYPDTRYLADYGLGLAFGKQKDYTSTLPHLLRAHQLYSGHKGIAQALSEVYKQLGRKSEAEDLDAKIAYLTA